MIMKNVCGSNSGTLAVTSLKRIQLEVAVKL